MVIGLQYPATFPEIDDLTTERLVLLWKELPPATNIRDQMMITKIRIVLEGRGVNVRG